ncbi:MAG: acyltransferase [Betaproteobacteria bacterium]|nr:acyltransferase [Betaproteobacteria bacterium]
MKELDSVQAMRGIAAIFVVCFHASGVLNNVYAQKNLGTLLFGSGYFGVDLFFIISGFIIVISTNDTSKQLPVAFLIRRFFRIVPMAWVGTILMHFLIKNNDIIFLLKSLFLIPKENERPPFFGYSLLSVAWTLTYEVIFYIVFAYAMRLWSKGRSLIASLILTLMIFGLQTLLYQMYTLVPGDAPVTESSSFIAPIVSLMANPLFFEFIFGMVIAELYISKFNIELRVAKYLFLFAVIYFLFVYASGFRAGHGITRIGHACTLLFVAFVFFEKSAGRLPIPEFILYLGKLSYSIYLIHLIVIFFVNNYNGDVEIFRAASGFSRLLLVLTLTISISALIFRFVENPVSRFGLYISWKYKIRQGKADARISRAEMV